MSLDLSRLENVRHRDGKITARCPACAEEGADTRGEHLMIRPDGRFACIQFQGPTGDVHRSRIRELAGEHSVCPYPFSPPPPKRPPSPPPRMPHLRPLTERELQMVADRRGWIEMAGLREMSRRGLLWYGDVFDAGELWPAWIITDSSRRNAQARRLDGQPWDGINKAKAKTLPGFDPRWPIGAADMGDRPFVILCEGGPDFLAALYCVGWEGFNPDQFAPACLTGAGNKVIHADALPLFHGKRVRICAHADAPGADAAINWARPLRDAGAIVDAFWFAGLLLPDGETPCKDLADFSRLYDSGEAPPVLLTEGFSRTTA